MGKVSRRRVDPEVEERMLEIFKNHIVSLRSSFDVQDFLNCLLSSNEQIMLAKRLAIAVLLYKGYTYEEINETIKVSTSTIGVVHKSIILGAQGYKKAASKVMSDAQLENFWHKLEEIMLKLTPPKRYGSSGWEEKSKIGKRLNKRSRQLSSL